MKEIGFCKDCKFRKTLDNIKNICTNKHIREIGFYGIDDPKTNDCLVYSYDEGGYFVAQDYFGCIYFNKL